MTIVQRILIFAALIAACVFVGDYAVFRVRGNPVENVPIRQHYAIPVKGNKVLYAPAENAIEQCVDSLFPHSGSRPCWYVKGHTRREIVM